VLWSPQLPMYCWPFWRLLLLSEKILKNVLAYVVGTTYKDVTIHNYVRILRSLVRRPIQRLNFEPFGIIHMYIPALTRMHANALSVVVLFPLWHSYGSPFFVRIHISGATLECRSPKCRKSKCRIVGSNPASQNVESWVRIPPECKDFGTLNNAML
jgi:hypothetical protein